MKLILVVIAAVCFALDALRIAVPFSPTPAGFCLLTIALLIL